MTNFAFRASQFIAAAGMLTGIAFAALPTASAQPVTEADVNHCLNSGNGMQICSAPGSGELGHQTAVLSQATVHALTPPPTSLRHRTKPQPPHPTKPKTPKVVISHSAGQPRLVRP
jgi:hypothetical protein